MIREEQIKEAALKECSSFDLPDKEGKFKGVNSAYGLGFCEGAMWADAHPPQGTSVIKWKTGESNINGAFLVTYKNSVCVNSKGKEAFGCIAD